MKKNVVIVGGGNQANYTIDIIEAQGVYNIIGIIDSICEIGVKRFGYTIIGRQSQIKELSVNYNFNYAIITVGDNWSRKLIYDELYSLYPKLNYINAVHPSVIIGKNVKLGQGIVAMAGCIINPNAVIEDFVFLSTGAQIEHDNIICKFASVSAGSVLGGYVKIGELASVTLGVTIVDRVEIGENSVVGSGSLVTKSIPSKVLVYGSPARIIKDRMLGEKFLK